MFVYEKKLEYPIRIKNSNPALAKFICSQYGGPDGELGASLRYLSQRYAMPYPELSAILTDIGTEELGHLEMVGTIVYQLTRSMTPEQIKQSGYDTYFVDHTAGVFPQFASGTPWTAATIGVTGDVIADLSEDMSAEQKARKTYDNILRLCDDPDVTDRARKGAPAGHHAGRHAREHLRLRDRGHPEHGRLCRGGARRARRGGGAGRCARVRRGQGPRRRGASGVRARRHPRTHAAGTDWADRPDGDGKTARARRADALGAARGEKADQFLSKQWNF